MIAGAAAVAGLVLFAAGLLLLAGARTGLIRLQITIAILAITGLCLAAIGAAQPAWTRLDAALALSLAAPGVVAILVGRIAGSSSGAGLIGDRGPND